MRYAIVGNNDGPLRLLLALKKARTPLPVFIGLQKKPDEVLQKKYQKNLDLIPFYTGFREKKLLQLLETQQPEILINCFCNFKFTRLLKLYRCYNIHPSYLPQYRGRHPMHWALINGEKTHGISLHKMNENYDDGPIVWRGQVSLQDDMSVAALRELLIQKLEQNFAEILPKIFKNNPKTVQNSAENGSYWRPRTPADSAIKDWNNAKTTYRLIKALRSEPNPAYLIGENGSKINIVDVEIEQKRAVSAATKPQLLSQKPNKIVVKTLDGQLLHLYIEPQAAITNFKLNLDL